MKSKLLEFEKSLEDELCSRVLIFLHKTIDENFPDAPKVASKRFSQTVVANYDKLNTEANLGVEHVNAVPPSVKDEDFFSLSSNSSNTSDTNKEQNMSKDGLEMKDTKSKEMNTAPEDTDPFGSLSNVGEEDSKYSAAFDNKKGFQDFAESEFNSEASKIFSDRYLNKVARKSRRGFFYRFVRFIFIVLILAVAIVFITGKQDEFMLMVKDFPAFYEKYLGPKIEDFKSYFKSNEKQDDDILDLLNNKK